MNISIEQLAKWLGVPQWDYYAERNADYFADKYYVPVINEETQMYEEEDMDPEDFRDVMEDHALEALADGEGREFSNYCNTLETIGDDFGTQMGISFNCDTHTGEVLVQTDDDLEGAEGVVDLINGIGLMSVMSVQDLMEQEGYRDYNELILDHGHLIGMVPEVYGEQSGEQQFYNQLS